MPILHLREIALNGLILNTMAGSRLQGVNTEDSDTDLLGICIEPPEVMVGIGADFEQYQFTNKTSKEAKSSPGDVEGTIYSLRKFCRLAAKGNPTVLSVLYATDHDQLVYRHELGENLQDHADIFLSKQAIKSFLGYTQNQRDRLSGEKKPRTNRPELVEKHGYDCKFAYHAIRLAHQGIELAETGKITQPLEPEFRQQMLDMRAGHYSRDEALDWCDDLIDRLEQLKRTSNLPEQADSERISSKLCGWYGRGWTYYARHKDMVNYRRGCVLCGAKSNDTEGVETQRCGTCS